MSDAWRKRCTCGSRYTVYQGGATYDHCGPCAAELPPVPVEQMTAEIAAVRAQYRAEQAAQKTAAKAQREAKLAAAEAARVCQRCGQPRGKGTQRFCEGCRHSVRREQTREWMRVHAASTEERGCAQCGATYRPADRGARPSVCTMCHRERDAQYRRSVRAAKKLTAAEK